MLKYRNRPFSYVMRKLQENINYCNSFLEGGSRPRALKTMVRQTFVHCKCVCKVEKKTVIGQKKKYSQKVLFPVSTKELINKCSGPRRNP